MTFAAIRCFSSIQFLRVWKKWHKQIVWRQSVFKISAMTGAHILLSSVIDVDLNDQHCYGSLTNMIFKIYHIQPTNRNIRPVSGNTKKRFMYISFYCASVPKYVPGMNKMISPSDLLWQIPFEFYVWIYLQQSILRIISCQNCFLRKRLCLVHHYL